VSTGLEKDPYEVGENYIIGTKMLMRLKYYLKNQMKLMTAISKLLMRTCSVAMVKHECCKVS